MARFNYQFYLIFSVMWLCISTAQAQTLAEIIQITLNDNPEIRSAKSDRLAVEQEISQARSGYLPSVDLNAGIGWEHSNNVATRTQNQGSVSLGRQETSLQINQMVFDGFTTKNEIDRHTARTNSRAYTVFGQSEIIGLTAVEAYINVLRRKELLALAKDNLAIHQKTYDQIRLRSDRGVGRVSDTDQSKGRLALAERNTLSEIGNLTDAQTAFLRIVGIMPDSLEPVKSPSDYLPESMQTAIEQAINNHPTLKSANTDIESANAQHETAKSPFFPRLDIEAGASYTDDIAGTKGRNEDMSVILRLRYNLFNGGKDQARRNETAYRISQAKDIRDNTYRQVVESMRLSWVAYETINQQLAYFKLHMDSSIKSNAAYIQQFNFGKRTLLDLLDSANEMFTAKSAYTDAKFNHLFAQYRILASKGMLNQFLNTQLPVEAQLIEQAE